MSIVTITDMDKHPKEYFFSTEHCQPLPDNFVPVTFYADSFREVRRQHSRMGDVEITNPDYNYIPDFILEELTR